MWAPDAEQANDLDYLSLGARLLQRGISTMLRRSGLLWNTERINNVQGTFFIENIAAGGQVFDSNYPFKVSDITAEALLSLFEQISQSNDLLTVHDVKWSFIFDPRSVNVGNATSLQIPSYCPPTCIDTWRINFYNGVQLNCAAFCLATAMTASKNYREICLKALDLMTVNNWTTDVSMQNILNIVPDQLKDYRVTVLIPYLSKHQDNTVEGPDYVYATSPGCGNMTTACCKKTIYIVYIVEDKHYGLVDYARHVIKYYQGAAKVFCNRCTTSFSRYKTCDCATGLTNRKRKVKAAKQCSFCSRVTCDGSGCSRNCRFCGVNFKKGYDQSLGEGHRCIVYETPSVEVFWKAGDDVKEKNPNYKLWVYDIECIAFETREKTFDFETNDDGFILNPTTSEAVVFERNVTQHRPNLLVYRNVFDPDTTPSILYGDNCIVQFLDFLLNVNQGRNIAIAHNGSGYDTRLIHEVALRHFQKPKIKVIRRGLKLMQLVVDNVKFRDSFMFLPSSLSALAKSFDLRIKKGTFPHMFNTVENQDYVGPIPDKRYFDLRFVAKSQKDIDSFNQWYETRLNTVWDFKKELVDYCIDDVAILADLVKLFHDTCSTKFQHSPWSFITAPAYVHKVVIQILSEAMDLPEDGEERSQVVKAKREKWSVLTPSEYWFVRNCLRGGRTDARALHYELTAEEKAKGYKIKYVDVVSMYPAVQVKHPYPVGEPMVHIYDEKFYPCPLHQNPKKGNEFTNCSCSFSVRENPRTNMKIILHETQPSIDVIKEKFGFICVSCIPNKHLYHPPLVAWDQASGKCVASLEPIIEGYFTTEEFKIALDLGYTVTKVHRIDEYEAADGLWNDFVKDLYIEKLANSGPPPDEAESRRVVEAYEKSFGMGAQVKESLQRWRYDGALRTVYKTLLNCGWGKHCQRPNMDQHLVVNADDAVSNKFFEDVQNGMYKASNVALLDNGYQIYTIQNTEKSAVNCHQTYIPAGCYVPAYGRITLFKELHQLGKRVLYHDTDSIIYIYKPDEYNIPENDLWGDWDEEKISKQGINEFVALGPKSYGVRTSEETIIKLKGLSIKHSHRNIVNFDKIKSFIYEHTQGNYPEVNVPQYAFRYKIGEGIKTVNFLKKMKFSPDHLKGQLVGMNIYPKGFCEACLKNEPCNGQ